MRDRKPEPGTPDTYSVGDEQEGGWDPGPGAVLDASGHVEQRFAGLDTPAPPVSAAPASVPKDEPELELARDLHRAPPPASEWESYPEPSEHPQPRRRAGVPLFAIGLVAALVAGGWFFGAEILKNVRHQLQIGRSADAAILKVYSQPSGARVMVGESELGTTPLLMDNLWPAGRQVEVELRLAGYETWRGTFEGGRTHQLEARLKPGK